MRAFFNGDDSNAVHNRRNEEPVDNYVNRTWEARSAAAGGGGCRAMRAFSPLALSAKMQRIAAEPLACWSGGRRRAALNGALRGSTSLPAAGAHPHGARAGPRCVRGHLLAAAQLRWGAQGGGDAAAAAHRAGVRGPAAHPRVHPRAPPSARSRSSSPPSGGAAKRPRPDAPSVTVPSGATVRARV